MTSAEGSLTLPSGKRSPLALLAGTAASPRLWAYIGCAALALLASCLLGKDMNWDTLDYHFYAGFSALHDRFGVDYFAGGSQSYFNPYVYVPFYLLASSGLSAIVVASILAIVQSGILWLTYELALQVLPARDGTMRVALAISSTLFAFGNPILLNLFGSSYADVTTAELVLGGWLLLLMAVRTPHAKYVVAAGLILGAASALKLTNSLHAVSAGVLLLFIPVGWRARSRYAAAFGVSLAACFMLVCLPWSIRLEEHFGNPFFPLFNEIFRSPQFPVAQMVDYRFIPDSLQAALWRPFAIAAPSFLVDDESQSPDVRYAVLLVTGVCLLLHSAWRMYRRGRLAHAVHSHLDNDMKVRALAALGAGFIVDWILWLTASGNGRYFIAMACVAAVLAVALIARLVAAPKIRIYVLAAILGGQLLQLALGTVYRAHIAWGHRPWFDVRLPANLSRTPALYLSYGVQSNAFLVPFLPPGSGFVNIAGDYPLAGTGANGAQVAALMRKYWPHVRVLARDERAQDKRLPVISGMTAAADALLPFGLRPNTNDCSTLVIPDAGRQQLMFVHTQLTGKAKLAKPIPDREVTESSTGYLTTCSVLQNPAHAWPTPAERQANLALDRLEDACPRLFQPARPVTQYFGDARQDIWARRYLNTNLTAWVTRGWVQFVDPVRGGAATYIVPVSVIDSGGARILCGRLSERYFAKAVPAAAPRGGR